MEVDSVHATIEQRARHVEVYTPMEWETIIKTARHTKPYKMYIPWIMYSGKPFLCFSNLSVQGELLEMPW